MLFQRDKLRIRKLEPNDKYVLAKWLSDQTVLEYYEGRDRPFTVEKVEDIFFHGKENEVCCIVEFDGKEIGYVQYYDLDEETRTEYGYGEGVIYGTDQFIGETEYWNRGIGRLLVKGMVTYLVEQLGAEIVVMDPRVENERAIRCYEKCGFTKVKLLLKRELHEGEYRDCWLMEYRSNMEMENERNVDL